MPRKAVETRICLTCPKPLPLTKARSKHSKYCDSCLAQRKQARVWNSETYKDRGFVEEFHTRFKRAGTKVRLQALASTAGHRGVGTFLEELAWGKK